MSEPPPFTRLYLVRHGQVAQAWQGRFYGSLDVPLAPAGEVEALRAAERLAQEPLAAVVSSGLARTEFGAELLRRQRGLARVDERDLRELDRGEWAGLDPAELERRHPGGVGRWFADPARERPPGGESLEDLCGRVLPAVERLAREYAGRGVALVVHSWVIRVTLCQVLGLELGRAPRLAVETGEIAVVDWPVVGEAHERPTLAALGVDRPPARGGAWFRGPRPAAGDAAAR